MDQPTVNAFIQQVLTGIVVAVISALTATHLALKRFRTEKWWEKKVDAYSRIIEALHNSKIWTDEHLGEEYHKRKMPEETKREITSRARTAREEIQKAINVGGFLLSDEALARLRKYEQETNEKHDSWVDVLESVSIATDKCLEEIITIAKRDLDTR